MRRNWSIRLLFCPLDRLFLSALIGAALICNDPVVAIINSEANF